MNRKNNLADDTWIYIITMYMNIYNNIYTNAYGYVQIAEGT